MTRLTAVNSSCEQASNPLTGWLAMLKRVKIDRESLVHTAKSQPGSNKNQKAELTSFPFPRWGWGGAGKWFSPMKRRDVRRLWSHFNRGFRTECRGVEIKPEFRPDLPPLGLFNFFSDFYMGVPLSPEGKKFSSAEPTLVLIETAVNPPYLEMVTFDTPCLSMRLRRCFYATKIVYTLHNLVVQFSITVHQHLKANIVEHSWWKFSLFFAVTPRQASNCILDTGFAISRPFN